MANYSIQFSCVLDLGSPENVAQAMQIFRPITEVDQADDKEWYGFMVQPNPESGPGDLWIHDGGEGDIDEVIEFVQHCAQTFGLTGRWGFQYAETCSKPRLDGFGGGAHVLDLATGETVDWLSTDGWLAATLDEGRAS